VGESVIEMCHHVNQLKSDAHLRHYLLEAFSFLYFLLPGGLAADSTDTEIKLTHENVERVRRALIWQLRAEDLPFGIWNLES